MRIALVSKDGIDTASLIAELEALDFVEVAGPNVCYESSSLPDDTFINQQYALGSTGVSYGDAYDAEPASPTEGNVVAIIDCGVDYTNPDLAYQMWTDDGTFGLGPAGSHGIDVYDNDYDIMPGSSYMASHGTHCAGIAAAAANNAEGICGVAGANSHTQIMGVKAAASTGGAPTTSLAVSAYQYLIKAKIAGVNIVAANDSWGSPTSDPVVEYVIDQAGKAGILTIAAADEQATGVEQSALSSPSGLESPYIISVAASNEDGDFASFSDYQATAEDLAAPGASILSTVPNSCSVFFTPLLSKIAGNANLDYYTNIVENVGQTGWTASLTDADGNRLSDAAQAALSMSSQNESGNAYELYGEDALQVSLDLDVLSGLGIDPTTCRASISWTANNPFYGTTGKEASDYGCNMLMHAVGDETGTQWIAYPHLTTSSGDDCIASDTLARSRRDIIAVTTKPMTALDTVDGNVTAGFTIQVTPESGQTGVASCLVSGYGYGRDTNPTEDSESAFVPYAFASGTSMAPRSPPRLRQTARSPSRRILRSTTARSIASMSATHPRDAPTRRAIRCPRAKRNPPGPSTASATSPRRSTHQTACSSLPRTGSSSPIDTASTCMS